MGGRAAPVRRGNEPKKTGARSARARTRGQNPLVKNNSGMTAIYCIEEHRTREENKLVSR
jgi:hypothetical protein